MKKSFIVVLSLIGIGIMIGIGFFFMVLSSKSSNYLKIKEAGSQNYEVNISYTDMNEEVSNLNFNGLFEVSSNTLTLNDEEEMEYKVSNNLYEMFAKNLDDKYYEEKSYTYVIPISNILSLDPFYPNLLKGSSLSAICTFDFFENKILSVNCLNNDWELIVDFYF